MRLIPLMQDRRPALRLVAATVSARSMTAAAACAPATAAGARVSMPLRRNPRIGFTMGTITGTHLVPGVYAGDAKLILGPAVSDRVSIPGVSERFRLCAGLKAARSLGSGFDRFSRERCPSSNSDCRDS
jgi:hypothetical protein